MKIVKIDISKMDHKDPNFSKLLSMSGVTTDKVSRKQRPTFISVADNMVSRISPSTFNSQFDTHFFPMLKDKFHCMEILSIKDLAENLRNYNTELSDQTFVYCHSKKEDLNEPAIQ